MNAFFQDKKELILIFVLVTLIYVPFLGKGFLTDDYVHLEHAKTASNFLLSPDPFQLYRPLVVFSFFLNDLVTPSQPFLFGLTNLLLHLGVIFALYHLVLSLSTDKKVAVFSCLAFIMTPKAHAIAVNWISGRTELLMAVFFLVSAIYWLRYMKQGKTGSLYLSSLFYLFCLLCKESGVLAPVFFFLSARILFHKKKNHLWLWPFGLVLMVYTSMRIVSGALMPVSADAHYNLAVPIGVAINNLFNYLFRSLPSPLFMLILVLLPIWLSDRLRWPLIPPSWAKIKPALFMAGSWFLLFITPVLFIKMRSELYLYLAGTGFCILCGHFLASVFTRIQDKNKTIRVAAGLGLSLFIILMSGYIMGRNIKMARMATFSERFVQTFKQQVVVTKPNSYVNLIPLDAQTKDVLRGSIHGYFDLVIKIIYNRTDIGGTIQYEQPGERFPDQIDITISCKDNHIKLEQR